MLKLLGTHNKAVVVLVATLFLLSGCTTMVARSDIGVQFGIPIGVSRNDVQERFGSPESSSISSMGRQIETYKISTQGVTNSNSPKQAFVAAFCVLYFVLCAGSFLEHLILDYRGTLLKIGMPVEVAFVYGADDRVLYFYEVDADSSTRFGRALQTLEYPLDAGPQKCASATDCVKHFIEEARRRASEVGHTLTQEDEERFRADLQAAKDLDESEIKFNKCEPIARFTQAPVRPSCAPQPPGESARKLYFLLHPATGSLLKKIEQGQCDSLVDCVSDYHRQARTAAVTLNYDLTCDDEETLQEELEIAREADECKIRPKEALSRIRDVSTRHLIRLYRRSR